MEEIKEIFKSFKDFGKEIFKKAKEKIENIKPENPIPKNLLEMDIKLGEKVQFSFQIKNLIRNPEKKEEK